MTDRIAASFGQDLHPWMQDAACHGADMFPGRKERETRDAKAVCGGCPQTTRTACLTYALDEGLDWGVFGGVSEGERRKLRRAGR